MTPWPSTSQNETHGFTKLNRDRGGRFEFTPRRNCTAVTLDTLLLAGPVTHWYVRTASNPRRITPTVQATYVQTVLFQRAEPSLPQQYHSVPAGLQMAARTPASWRPKVVARAMQPHSESRNAVKSPNPMLVPGATSTRP